MQPQKLHPYIFCFILDCGYNHRNIIIAFKMSIFIIHIFQSINIDIAQRKLFPFQKSPLHILFKIPPIIKSCPWITISLIFQDHTFSATFGNISNNMYVYLFFLPFNSIGCYLIDSSFTVFFFPNSIFIRIIS